MSEAEATSPAIAVDIAIACDSWGDEAAVRATIERILAGAVTVGRFDLPPMVELSVVLTDDARIRELNRVWRGKDKATNVLSFPAGELGEEGGAGEEDADRPVLLGDIVIAHETMLAEAANDGKSAQDHFCHLLVHGFVHLMGYDHEDDAEAEEMEALETEILAALGVSDPYAELST